MRRSGALTALVIFLPPGLPAWRLSPGEGAPASLGGSERGPDRWGPGRQLGAVLASGDRTAKLRTIKAPALVIHGTKDKLINPSGGRATAKAIPGSKLVMIEGMGHDLPRGVWPRILDGIAETAGRAPQPAVQPAA